MRDDVKELLNELAQIYTQRRTFLKRLVLLQADMQYCINSDDERNLENIIIEFNTLTGEIDATDFDISSLEQKTAEICRIQPHRLVEMIEKEENENFKSVNIIRKECKTILKSITERHNSLIEKMELGKRKTKKSIKELQEMRKFSSDLPGS